MSFNQLLAEDRRLSILRVLEKAPSHRANHYVMQTALSRFGHDASRDMIKDDFAWLEETGLIALEHIAPVYVATLTGRGEDVAYGRANVPGVKRPAPMEYTL